MSWTGDPETIWLMVTNAILGGMVLALVAAEAGLLLRAAWLKMRTRAGRLAGGRLTSLASGRTARPGTLRLPINPRKRRIA